MQKYIILILVIALLPVFAIGQQTEPENGVAQLDIVYAISNAKIIVSSTTTIEKGTVVVKDGKILAVGTNPAIPKNAVKINGKGYTIYPSFIDAYATEGFKKVVPNKTRKPQLNTLKIGPFYWNESIHPEFDAFSAISIKEIKDHEKYISQGFGTISTHHNDGVLRGTAACLTLDDQQRYNQFIKNQAANHYSFSKGSSKQTYPSSQMGAIALIRQFNLDADWYANNDAVQVDNDSYRAGIENLKLPQIFEAADKLEVLRIAKLADELKLKPIVRTGGDDYERIAEIKASGVRLILPLNFPVAYDMSDPYLSRFVTLADLKDWEMKRYNPYIVAKNDIEFALTAEGLKDRSDFLKNLRLAVKHGLSPMDALKALTEQPANFLDIADAVGTIDVGKWANLILVKGDVFKDGEIYENWIRGERHRLKNIEEVEVRGTYDINLDNNLYQLIIAGDLDKLKSKVNRYDKTTQANGTVKMDTVSMDTKMEFDGLQCSFSFIEKQGHYDGFIQLNGSFNPTLGVYHGKAMLPTGDWVDWSAIRSKPFVEDLSKKKPFTVDTSAVNNIFFPNMAYGFDTIPAAKSYFITNATIWTNEAEGIVKNATLLIHEGKIKAVNKSVVQIPNGAITIDAKGKHVTSGIIDEHSHIAISKGVNEGGQSVTAEVSIADVVRSNDINIYRQLAGGVTTSQLLHGSANAIGGQSALIKLKWGTAPEELLMKDAPGFIKFALGENVKQSNWGDHNTVRFPQTRMGVEQVFYDAFIRAKAYKIEWDAFNELSNKKKAAVIKPRKDLELEALNEILDEKRFITCHSYIQSEINMLMKVGDSMNFRVNTFTHILEGYKVAEEMKLHGAGASTFADWWAYKFEVNDAIPYNAAMLHRMGIVTAINSDDAEMGRRLNHEAAKIVKYGGVSETEAWKMVTLNPAILLHVDDRIGSIKVGKDADIVIWSDNPLSVHAKAEQTFIEGVLYYDINRSAKLNTRDQLDRSRIMKLMMEEKKNGAETKLPTRKENRHYHCDTVGE
ncbi:amidohydrolase family protein [Crocinitomix catalasitica]|uniref:amidohydrolase family protein n=1 Tax=Crocinitomix catalasitica TaxID=184607 RepID=UPI000484F06E|nr:amidohydrolase family protein [Crocinitomix catalasitica]